MNEQDVRGPEQYVLPSRKELRPGETARSLEKNTEVPLKSAEEMRKLTGLDLPATMAIEFDNGPETQQLLIVPVERGKNEDFNADYLVVNPDLMLPDDPDSIVTGVGFKGLRAGEGGVKIGAGDDNIDERVNARLGLQPGKSPNLRMQVDAEGKLHISVNPNSPQKVRLVQPAEQPPQESTAASRRDKVADLDAPTVPLTLSERLTPVENSEATDELSTDEVFESNESFLATLNDPNLSQAHRTELIEIMSQVDRRRNVKDVTELWQGELGESMAELAPKAQEALAEAAAFDSSFREVHGAARELSELLDVPNYANQVPGAINKVQGMLDQLANQLEYNRACDTFVQSAGELTSQEDKNTDHTANEQTEHPNIRDTIVKVFKHNTILQDPAKLDALVEAHVPEEKLGQMRLRLEDQVKQEPGYDKWGLRRKALESIVDITAHMSNQDLATQLRNLNFRVQSDPDSINYFLYQLAPQMRDKFQDTSQRAYNVAYAA